MFKLRIIQAKKGDCLVLAYGTDTPHYLLIDGGPADVFEDYLTPELKRMQAAGGVLDCVVLSHIDDDHANGLLDFFTKLEKPGRGGKWLRPAQFWHNTFSQLVGAPRADRVADLLLLDVAAARDGGPPPETYLLELGVKGFDQGDKLTHSAARLGIGVNPGFPPLNPDGTQGLICSNTAGGPRSLGDLCVRIVGPTRANLERLGEEWDSWLEAHGKKGLDTRTANLSSIMFLAESPDHKRILFTGDGRGDEIIGALNKAGLLDPGTKQLRVDVLKVPHHGSSNNVSVEFFRTVIARHYAISANGENDNPDFATLRMLTDARRADGEPYYIWITNETQSTCDFRAQRPPSADYRYRFVQLPYDLPGEQQVLELDLEAADPAVAYPPLAGPFYPVAIEKPAPGAPAPGTPATAVPAGAAPPPAGEAVPDARPVVPAPRPIGGALGLSIHIGLNRVDPRHYTDRDGNPWEGKLVACEADARDMQALAVAQGFTPQLLLTGQATAEAVTGAVRDAARRLRKGDILFLTYSGHGSQVPDRNDETRDEPDDMDETWCLYDRQLVDDELYSLWCDFAPGVRIFMLSDSCHSGSVAKDVAKGPGAPPLAMRVLPQEVQANTYKSHRTLYDDVQSSHPLGEALEIGATVILISGCQDNQVSFDGPENGLFTGVLLKTWKDGRFKGGLVRFYREIVRAMPFIQSPNLFKIGPSDSRFERGRPFTI